MRSNACRLENKYYQQIFSGQKVFVHSVEEFKQIMEDINKDNCKKAFKRLKPRIYFYCEVCGQESFHTPTYFQKCVCPNCVRERTLKEKYGEGVVNNSQRPDVKEKLSIASKKNAKTTVEKMKKTCLERYGVETFFQRTDIIKKAMNDKYGEGIDNPSQIKAVVEKKKKNSLEKYGVEYPIARAETKAKIRATNLERYGGTCPPKSQEVVDKMKQTCMDRYGVDNVWKTDAFKKDALTKKRAYLYRNIVNVTQQENLFEIVSSEEDFLKTNKISYLCKKCGKIIECDEVVSRYSINHRACYHLRGISKAEKQVVEFLKDVYPGKIEENRKKYIYPYELDIYLPDLKLAIEYDGLYFHSNSLMIEQKTTLCEEKGIRLIHIFESEWLSDPIKVKNYLKSQVGIFTNTIYARKCEIKNLSTKDYAIFCEENHLQNAVNASIRLGLYHEGNLVQLMSFSKARLNKNYEYEIIRECSKQDTHIVGGKERLFKRFCDEYKPKSVVSYCDRRLFKGTSYTRLGFKLDHVSKPNYFYYKLTKHPVLESRLKYQKHKLKNILGVYDENLSEWENMINNKYSRIYDCGNFVYVKEFK